MKFNLKNVLLSVGILVFALVLVGFTSINKAEANTCTAVATGDWHTVGNWGGCGGILPQAADDVVVPTNVILTMSGDSSVTSITFSDAVAAANGIVLSGNTLTVSGATTYTATTGAAGSSITVDTGAFSTATLVINDGAAAGDMVLSVSTGTITVTGHISGTWTNAADVQFTSSGASNINLGGNLPAGGTLDGTGGTITFNGTGAQDVGTYTTYNNVVINKASGIATLLGTTTFLGTFTLTSGELDTNTRDFTATGASDITGILDLDTGTKTFTGNVTLNAGANWDETGAAAVVYGGNLANAATTFTASTGAHTFGGSSKVISGATATVIPTVHITDDTSTTGTLTCATLLDVADGKTLTNTGTVTATTALSDIGATGTFVNSTDGTLNLGGVSDISALTATASGNTVNYTEGGAQTVFVTAYRNLGISGSGAKTMTGVTTLTGDFTVSGSVTATPVITTIGGNVSITGTAVITTGAINAVTGTLTVGSGTTLTMGDFALTIGDTSLIIGTIDTTGGATGVRTFTGPVTIQAGATWDLSGQNPATSFAQGITMNGTTFNNGTGAAAFSLDQSLEGIVAMTFGGTVTPAVTKTLTNNNTGGVTVSAAGSIVLTGNYTQGTNAVLSVANAAPFSGAGTFTGSGSGNTVTYTGASAAIKAGTYNNLTVNGSGTATSAGVTIVNGTMTATTAVTNSSTLTVTTLLAVADGITFTNTGTVTATTALSDVGTTGIFLNSTSGTLNIGALSDIGTLTATAVGNTVNFTQSGAQTVFPTAYRNLGISGSGAKTMTSVTTLTGDFTVSGSVTATPVITTIGGNVSITGTAVITTGATNVVTGTLTVGTGASLTIGGFALTIGGTSSVTGTVDTVTASTGTKTFTGAVTINAGGVWDLSTTNPGTSFAGGIVMSGTTFNNGTGAAAFSASQAFTGAESMTFGGLIIPAGGFTLTNSNTGTVTVASTGGVTLAGNFTQGVGSTLALAATAPFSGSGTFDASTNANTVNYTGAAQTVKAVAYKTLGLSGSGAKTVTGVTTIGTDFNMSGSVTATPVITTVGGDVSVTGTAVMTTGAANVVTGTLTVGTGASLTMGGFALTVGGVTDITGTLSTTSATGTKTFTGAVTVNDGGVWNFATGGPAVSLAAGLTVDGSGTFSSGAGTYTVIDGAAQTLGGTRAITISTITNNDATGNGLTLQDDGVTVTTLTQGTNSVLTFAAAMPTITTLDADSNVNTVQYLGATQAIKADAYSTLIVNGSGTTSAGTVTVAATMTVTTALANSGTLTVATLLEVANGITLTNTGTVTATTALSDVGTTGTFLNSTDGTLNIGGLSDIGTLTASASGNTVNYTKAGAQTVKDAASHTYVNLGLSGSGAKTITAATVIGGDLTIDTATATLSGVLNTANKLYFATALQRPGTWGSTSSSASYKNNTYFTAGVNALVTVATGSSSGGSTGGGGSKVTCGSSFTLVDGACVAITTEDPATTPVTTSTVEGCGSRTTGFSTTTGATCVGNVVTIATPTAVAGCGSRTTGFSTTTGATCVGNVVIMVTSTTPTTTPTSPTIQTTYNFGTAVLKNGSRGEAVKELQRFLNATMNLGLVIDGMFGPNTTSVMKKWQAAHGLVVDGLVGPATKAMMHSQ